MPSKIFSIRPAKLLTIFFYQLSNFRTIRSLDAPSRAASCPGNDIFLFIFCHLPTFFLKNWPLGCPQGGCPGPSHRPHPPLHTTVYRTKMLQDPEQVKRRWKEYVDDLYQAKNRPKGLDQNTADEVLRRDRTRVA